MTKLNNGERLVALETKMDIVIATVEKTNGKLDRLLPTYATKEELEAVKRRNTWITVLVGVLSAIFGSVLTYLVNYFLTTVGR